MESTPPPPRSRRLRRWLLAAPIVAAIAVTGAFFSVPWLVNRPFIKEAIAGRVNAILTPGRVSFESLSVSWFGPSAATRVELFDHEGRRVLTAPRATLDWNLFQILFARPKVANVELIEGRADLARESNGEINLIDTIRPFLVPRPEHTVVIRLQHGTVQLRGAGDGPPFVGEDADVRLEFAAYPSPISWDVKLAQPSPNGPPGSLAFKGKAERVAADGSETPDIELTLTGERWAWSTGRAGSALSGRIDGSLDARRHRDRWSSSGRASVEDFVAEAGAIPGGLTQAKGGTGTRAEWDVVDSPTGWEIRKVRVISPFVTLDARGNVVGNPGTNMTLALDAELSDFDLPDPRDPSKRSTDTLKTSIKLAYDAKADRVDLSGLDLAIPMVRLRGAGSVAGLTAQRAVDLRGTIEPDWEALQKLLAEKVEPRARLAGRARGWALTGTIPTLQLSELSKTLEGEAGVELDLVDVFGMRLSRTALVGRFQKGTLAIDPIDSTLNGGPLHLEPSLVVDDAGHRALTLGPGSRLTDAEVNEEVSHRVLSYVAPVMDQATRVSGKVSVAIADAVFPLDSTSGVKPKVEGEVSFEQVEFAPGPFADMLLDTFARERRPTLVLNEPVSLTIVDGRIYQEGLAVPVGKAAEVGLEGWVGFDRTLDLTASVTLTPDKSGTNPPLVASIFRGTKFAFPIRGTLDDPKLDTKALGQNFKEMGTDLLGRTLSSATGGIIPSIEGLKNLFGGPRNGDGPEMDAAPRPLRPRVTPEERRARRQERKLERMRKRGEIE